MGEKNNNTGAVYLYTGKGYDDNYDNGDDDADVDDCGGVNDVDDVNDDDYGDS
jgi:hypothetical protein